MRAEATSHSAPSRRRGKPSIAALTALLALAVGVQVLAPAPAAAMDDEPTAGECQSVWWIRTPGQGWNGAEQCSFNDGAGDGGGGAVGGGDPAGDGSGDAVGSETIVIEDELPFCASEFLLCEPHQTGGAGRPSSDRGSNPREPKRIAANNGAAKRSRGNKEARPRCLRIARGLVEIDSKQVVADWQLIQQAGWDRSTPKNAFVQAKREALEKVRELAGEWERENCTGVTGHKPSLPPPGQP